VQNNYFRFQLGDLECMSILDTSNPIKYDFIFPEIPSSEVLSELERRKIPVDGKFDINCLVIKNGNHTILVDTGLGTGTFAVSGLLLDRLKEAGIKGQDIDTVIISHGHLDHIGGNFDTRGKNNYPNARYVIFRKEWDFWASEPDLTPLADRIQQELRACVNKNLNPLQDVIHLFDSGIDIEPGIQYFETPGHTPGQAGLLITSGVEKLICLADVFHNLLQLNKPSWNTAFDLDHEQTPATRKQILNMATSTNSWVFSSHFPFPAIGHIIKQNDGYVWQPVE
jgi:glyoxylase-like metal-dependent hydrolase (beta-lactamase superfamily II)